jgi:hypothetical protein
MENEIATLSPTELVACIEKLMAENFEGLVQLLYRIDVSEKEIKNITTNFAIDANTIAQIITLRIEEKKANKAYWTKYFHGDDVEPI